MFVPELPMPEFTPEEKLALELEGLRMDLRNIGDLYFDAFYEQEGEEGYQRVRDCEAKTKARIQELEQILSISHN